MNNSMLIQAQKQNLSKLLDRYSFEHLRPSPEVYQITIPQTDHFMPTSSSDKRRKIYYKVKYQTQESEAINEVKKILRKQGINQKLSDELILKHVYMAKWDVDKTVQRLKKVMDFHSHKIVTTFNESTIKKLEGGCIYSYGQDKGMRPVVVMRVDKFDFKLPIQQNLNAVYYLMLVVLGYRMVPYHAQKYTMIMDFNDVPFNDIPKIDLYNALEKMGTYYCGNTQRTLLYNSEGINNIWRVIKFFIPQNQKKRIIFIQKGEEKKALEYIDQYELQKKYGGKLPNLDSYWPPKNPHDDQFNIQFNKGEEDSFFSVQNNQEFFAKYGQSETVCGRHCSCQIY